MTLFTDEVWHGKEKFFHSFFSSSFPFLLCRKYRSFPCFKRRNVLWIFVDVRLSIYFYASRFMTGTCGGLYTVQSIYHNYGFLNDLYFVKCESSLQYSVFSKYTMHSLQYNRYVAFIFIGIFYSLHSVDINSVYTFLYKWEREAEEEEWRIVTDLSL